MMLPLEAVARLAASQDNVAIAVQELHAGTQLRFGEKLLSLSHTIPVGHRFAVTNIAAGEALLSWGQTFGLATRPIAAGDYVINEGVRNELQRRSITMALPDSANFRDDLERFSLDLASFVPAQPVPRYETDRHFMGYVRAGGRGVGTRNTIILLGTTALVSGFVRQLEARLQPDIAQFLHIDGIVAVAHTEGAHGQLNNQELLLRTLAGFIVHPNVAAALIVDDGHQSFNNTLLQDYMQREGYPLDAIPHHFMRLSDSFERDVDRGAAVVRGWLETTNTLKRTPQPMSELKIALQCGGSDAFSGISGNPLAAWVAKEVIRYGGAANLAETDELIGAEAYLLDKVRDAATAQKFLAFVQRFQERVGWHGHSAEGNPSGGNKFRGLYNIYLKSLGAATKRHPDVRLDAVIDYAERMSEGGFYFMDSPGNDLESIAGQVAAGCNVIFFITGNGSITNFPFVPTIKIVTTTARFQLLENEMDINAGAYLDGVPLQDVGEQTLDYTLEVASGKASAGERAGHAQVQIWRDWHFTQAVDFDAWQGADVTGLPLPIQADLDPPDVALTMYRRGDVPTSDQVGLILPTSLCSGQIAKLCVSSLNQHPMLAQSGISRFVTLTHTEGCGASINSEFQDTLVGYLAHPFVKHALLIEHGCEATHNDYFRHAIRQRNLEPEQYGWASIQLDGGIQAVMQKMAAWFEQQIQQEEPTPKITAGLGAVRLAIITADELPDTSSLADVTKMIVKAGGTVMIGEQDALLQSDYLSRLGITGDVQPTLAYAAAPQQAGLHIMAMPTHNWIETLAGLGTQVDLFLGASQRVLSGHPMIPMLHLTPTAQPHTDLVLGEDATSAVLSILVDTLSGQYIPKVMLSGNVNFQITRGLFGISL